MICTRCHAEKLRADFHSRSDGRPRRVCKACQHRQAAESLKRRRETTPGYHEAKRKKDRTYRQNESPESRCRRLSVKRAHNKAYHSRAMMLRRERYRSDPSYRLRINVGREMRKQLADGKGRKRWQDAVGYTVEALRAHLERQFTAGMSWSNYGVNGWHVDHIVPVAEFNLREFGDDEFKACWALSNLRPLWSDKNRKKRDHRLHLL